MVGLNHRSLITNDPISEYSMCCAYLQTQPTSFNDLKDLKVPFYNIDIYC